MRWHRPIRIRLSSTSTAKNRGSITTGRRAHGRMRFPRLGCADTATGKLITATNAAWDTEYWSCCPPTAEHRRERLWRYTGFIPSKLAQKKVAAYTNGRDDATTIANNDDLAGSYPRLGVASEHGSPLLNAMVRLIVGEDVRLWRGLRCGILFGLVEWAIIALLTAYFWPGK